MVLNKMQKNKKILIPIVIVFMAIGGMLIYRGIRPQFSPLEGFIPDEITATRIAEAVWLPIYGESIYNKQPYEVKYNMALGYWRVTGTLPENVLGGVPEVHIRRSDGKILYVYHGK